MKGRRYSEGGEPSELKFGIPPESELDKMRSIKRNTYLVPDDVSEIVSKTSMARDCFVDRHYSKKMQQFMLHYSYSILTSPILSGEI